MTSTTISQPSLAPPSRHLPLLLLLFVGSGCAALIYEIIWYQMLQLVIGLTTVSLGVLLGTFMGGMCLGSLLLPRLISKRVHPLRVYAFLELGIGIIGLLVLAGMPILSDIYIKHFGYNFAGMALRVGIAIVCLIPPTLLMGATLPAIARWVESTPQGVSWLGFFYGGNIAGAVFGCLFAGFYLLRVHDIYIATYVAALINLTVCVLALTLAAFAPHQAAAPAPAHEGPNGLPSGMAVDDPPAERGYRAAYWAIALSGASAMGAEVVWTRLLGLIFGGTVYTFSIILAVFLAGLGIGSTVGSWIARESRQPRFVLGVCQLLLTLAIAWTAFMISGSLPFWPIDPTKSSSPWFNFQLDMARTFWAIFPGALLWGASFPLALAAVARRDQDPGRLVGGVYAANTVGAIVGSLLFSVVFVQLFGSQNSERILIVIAAISAAIMIAPALLNARVNEPRFSRAVLIMVTPILAFVLAWSVQAAPWSIIAYGRFSATYGDQLVPGISKVEDVHQGGDKIWCTYQGEGLNGSVAVTESSSGVRSFHSAGKVQASNDPLDMKLQRMLGHISALAVAHPKKVLVVACGAGVTAGTFLLHPDVEEITICDIEKLVPTHVTPMFSKENYGITDGVTNEEWRTVRGKRVRVIFDDGRHFIHTTKEKFDIISSDPIDPWVKGCAALNTVEYYQMCKDHLNPGGVMSLWIPLYEGSLVTTKSVIGTFFHVFDKEGIVWSNDNNGAGYDAVLFAQQGGSHFDVDQLQDRLDKTPEVAQSLEEVGFKSAVDLLGSFAAFAPDMKGWMDDPTCPAQINWDRDMRLQYIAGMYLNTYQSENILNDILRYRKFPDSVFSGTGERFEQLKVKLAPKP